MATRFAFDSSRLPAPLIAAASAAGGRAQQAYNATDFARRVALAREAIPEEHELGKPRLMRLLGEAQVLAEPLRRPRRKLEIAPTANPQVAMILPGFATHPMRMRYLARSRAPGTSPSAGGWAATGAPIRNASTRSRSACSSSTRATGARWC